MANEVNPLKVVLGMHRISYVHLKEPTKFEDGSEPKYDVTFLIPKDHPDVAKINKAIRAAYDANKESLFKGMPLTSNKMWNPLRDGDEWIEEHPEAVEYEGMYFLKASSKSQPAVFDKDKQDIFDLDTVYSGCYCRGVIACYPFNNKSKGHGFYLNSVMFMEDGEKLGGYTASADDYDEDEYTPAPKAIGSTPKPAAARPAKKTEPERIWDTDANGEDIYSDDGGETWYYPA